MRSSLCKHWIDIPTKDEDKKRKNKNKFPYLNMNKVFPYEICASMNTEKGPFATNWRVRTCHVDRFGPGNCQMLWNSIFHSALMEVRNFNDYSLYEWARLMGFWRAIEGGGRIVHFAVSLQRVSPANGERLCRRADWTGAEGAQTGLLERIQFASIWASSGTASACHVPLSAVIINLH